MKNNRFSYETKAGNVKGKFNIYQAGNGKIYMQMGKSTTPLSYEQIKDLQIDIFSIKGLDHNAFLEAYTDQKVVKYA